MALTHCSPVTDCPARLSPLLMSDCRGAAISVAVEREKAAFRELNPGAVEVTAFRQQPHSTGGSGEPLFSGQLTPVAPRSGSYE